MHLYSYKTFSMLFKSVMTVWLSCLSTFLSQENYQSWWVIFNWQYQAPVTRTWIIFGSLNCYLVVMYSTKKKSCILMSVVFFVNNLLVYSRNVYILSHVHIRDWLIMKRFVSTVLVGLIKLICRRIPLLCVVQNTSNIPVL